MLKIIGFMFKFLLFTAAVLVLGSLIRWNGRTISDQVKTQISSAQRYGERQYHSLTMPSSKSERPRRVAGPSKPRVQVEDTASEEIPSSERQKLRQLIRELNSSGS